MVERSLVKALRKVLTEPKPADQTPFDMVDYKIVEALGMMGDELVEDYQSGRMSREEGLRIARQRQSDLRKMGLT